jgi:bifunctional non-homologous end joining protein LigD
MRSTASSANTNRIGAVKITRPEKILFPEDGITKGDLIRYYERIAPSMLPYLEGRPVSMQRFPDGIDGPVFFQKAASPYFPSWIRKVTMKKTGGTVRHVVIDDVGTLIYLANQACITPHVWLSRYDKPRQPDQMIFDLDPSTEELSDVIEAARAFKAVLDDLELPAYVKATGSRGLHITVPLKPKEDFDEVRAFARELASIVIGRNPDRYTMEQYKNKRGGRVFIDTNRNGYAQTAVPAYAVRPRRGAPVAVPIAWDELRRKSFRPDGVTIQTVFERLESIPDPWKDFRRRATSLDNARKKLKS